MTTGSIAKDTNISHCNVTVIGKLPKKYKCSKISRTNEASTLFNLELKL